MMKFNYSLLAAALLTGTVVLSSCSGDELPVGNEQPVANELQVAPESAMTYSFSVPAVMGEEADTRLFDIGESSIDSRFDEEDRVYVYIKSGNGLIYANDFLTPSNISSDGKKCTLAFDGLSFIYNSIAGGLRTYTPQEGDVVYFYYGMNLKDIGDEPYYSFATNGSKVEESYKDYCLAEMVVKSIDDNGNMALAQKDDDTKRYFTFRNINSIFRQKVTVKDILGKESTYAIKTFSVDSRHGKTVQYYYPFSSDAYRYNLHEIDSLDFKSGNNIYFSMMFNEENKKIPISFIATDVNGAKYVATKGIPGAGFENNKYYYGNVELKPDAITPNISGTANIEARYQYSCWEVGTRPDRNGNNDITNDITISGRSEDCKFFLRYSPTITMNNLNATNPGGVAYKGVFYFYDPASVPTIINLIGNNNIDAGDGYIFAAPPVDPSTSSKYRVRFKCEGNQATLTVKMKDPAFFFHNLENPYMGMFLLFSGTKDVSDILAHVGYTVERGPVVKDQNTGFYSCTFTVKKEQ